MRLVRRLRRLGRDDRGTSTALFALLLPVMLGMQALTLDVTRLYAERRHLQNVADAASLAAAAYLPGSTSAIVAEARSAAQAYGTANGVTIASGDIDFSTDSLRYDRVEVRTSTTVPFAFARTFGITSADTGSMAVAQMGQLASASGVLPFGVVDSELRMGDRYCLVLDRFGSDGPCGSARERKFYAMDVDDTSTSTSIFRSRIATGSLTVLERADRRRVVTTNAATALRQGLTTRLQGDSSQYAQVVEQTGDCDDGGPPCRFRVLNWRSRRIALVPMVSYNSSRVTVTAFGVMFIESNPGSGTVIGRFIATIVPGGTWAALDDDGDDYGAHVVRLLE